MPIDFPIPVLILTFFAVIAAVVYTMLGAEASIPAKRISKAAASVLFFALGNTCFFVNMSTVFDQIRCEGLILFGLLFGVIGDILLSFRHSFPVWTDVNFIRGMLAFLIGHFFYLFCFNQIYGLGLFQIIISIVILFFMVFLSKCFKLAFGNKAIAIVFYMAMLSFLIGMSIGNAIIIPSLLSYWMAAASILFVFSDSTLALTYFGHQKYKKLDRISTASYYSAQILFALSIWLMK